MRGARLNKKLGVAIRPVLLIDSVNLQSGLGATCRQGRGHSLDGGHSCSADPVSGPTRSLLTQHDDASVTRQTVPPAQHSMQSLWDLRCGVHILCTAVQPIDHDMQKCVPSSHRELESQHAVTACLKSGPRKIMQKRPSGRQEQSQGSQRLVEAIA